MFDCRTNRTPIERLGLIGFNWVLVRFRSIDYAGKEAWVESMACPEEYSACLYVSLKQIKYIKDTFVVVVVIRCLPSNFSYY